MEPSIIPPIQSSSFVQEGISQATMEVGTNYAPLVHHSQVKTAFNLRFEGGHPVQVQPVYDAQQQTVGWELRVTGIDELQHLVMAFETAAAELRRQGGGVLSDGQTPQSPAEYAEAALSDPLTQPPTEVPDQVANAQALCERSEFNVLCLLVRYGQETLPNGKNVREYLNGELTNAPLTSASVAEVWQQSEYEASGGVVLSLAWLTEYASKFSQQIQDAIMLEVNYFARGEMLAQANGHPKEGDQLQLHCDRALAYLQQARIRLARMLLLAQISDDTLPEQESIPLIAEYQELGKQEIKLTTWLHGPVL